KREQPARAGRHLLRRPRHITKIRSREPRTTLHGHAVAAGDRADHEPFRATLLQRRTTRGARIHRQRNVHRPAVSTDQRRISAQALDLLRARSADPRMDWYSLYVLRRRSAEAPALHV